MPSPTPRPPRLIRHCSALVALIMLSPIAQAKEELGRLFFTPEYRQDLDRRRQHNIQERQAPIEESTLTINGLVTRSNGKRTVWINGVAQNENETRSGIAVTPNRKEPGKVIVQPNDAPQAKVKIGDTVNRNTGKATDLLDGGSIRIRSSTPTKSVGP